MKSEKRIPKIGENIHYIDIRYGCLPAKPYEVGGWITVDTTLTSNVIPWRRTLNQIWFDDLVDLTFEQPERITKRLDCRRENVLYYKQPTSRTWHYIEDCTHGN